MKFRKAKQDDKEEILALYQSLIGTPYCAWGNGYPGEQEFDYDMKRNALFCMENEAGALLLECLRAFTGIEELCFLPVNPDYYIWTGMVTGIDGLKMRSNGYAGTWLLLQSESQVKKLRMLATIYSMDYPDLVDSVELARRLAKEEAAGQCIRSRHGIVLFTEEGLVYMDGTNPDNDWELKYPIYENDCYYEMLRFAYRKQVSGELENYCAWKAWLNRNFT